MNSNWKGLGFWWTNERGIRQSREMGTEGEREGERERER